MASGVLVGIMPTSRTVISSSSWPSGFASLSCVYEVQILLADNFSTKSGIIKNNFISRIPNKPDAI